MAQFPFNTRQIKANHGHQDTRLGKIIRTLCDRIETQARNARVKDHTYQQVVNGLKAKIWMLEHNKKRKVA